MRLGRRNFLTGSGAFLLALPFSIRKAAASDDTLIERIERSIVQVKTHYEHKEHPNYPPQAEVGVGMVVRNGDSFEIYTNDHVVSRKGLTGRGYKPKSVTIIGDDQQVINGQGVIRLPEIDMAKIITRGDLSSKCLEGHADLIAPPQLTLNEGNKIFIPIYVQDRFHLIRGYATKSREPHEPREPEEKEDMAFKSHNCHTFISPAKVGNSGAPVFAYIHGKLCWVGQFHVSTVEGVYRHINRLDENERDIYNRLSQQLPDSVLYKCYAVPIDNFRGFLQHQSISRRR